MSNIFIAAGIVLILIGVVIKFRSPNSSIDSATTHDVIARESNSKSSPDSKVYEEVEQSINTPGEGLSAHEGKSPEQEQLQNKEPESKAGKQERESGKNVTRELSSKAKGNEFEAFYADILKYNKIRIKEWNQGTLTKGGAMGENALNPDFFVIQKVGDLDLEYWVECKWRKSLASYKALPEYQYERYKKIQRESHRKIFIAIGIGGTPDKPQEVYVVPLDSLPDGKISKAIVSPYFHSDPKMQHSSRIKDYFYTKVFRKNR